VARRRRTAIVLDVRRTVAERFRDLDAHLGRLGRAEGFGLGAWRRKAEQLEAGESVVVYPGDLKDWLSPDERARSFHWRIESDGTLTPVRPVKVGNDIVDWKPVTTAPSPRGN
jgi:hypothetical protein